MTGWIITGGVVALLGIYGVALAVVIDAADRQETQREKEL